MPNNSISDISAVQNLTQLVELYFQNNAVSDLSPLVANTGLGTDDELDVRGNPLSYPSIYTHIPVLQAKDVYIDFDNRVATAPVKISGDTQQGNTGATLTQPFIVEVRDGSRVAFAGVPVTFTVIAGGGTLSATNTMTDANGRAQSTLTLGNTAGTNTVRVSVTGITQTITFTATATAPPVVVSIIPIANRTSQVAEAILNVVKLDYLSVSSYAGITATHLAAQTALYLNNRSITALKSGDFDGFTSLDELRLNNNQLTFLPSDIFSGLTSLSNLNLYNNRLSSLPDGIFEGLTSLTTIRLGRNTVDPLPITISLEKVAEGQFKAVAPTGATFNYVLPITVTNGIINGGATTLIISQGSMESGTLTVTRTAGTTAAVTVNIGTLPSLLRNHYGYALVKSDDLPLEVIGGDRTASLRIGVNIPDANLRAKIESALGKTSGATISAAEMATLTTLTAQDASISNLTGLETATNLTTLKLGNNAITNLSAISGLTNLTELQLWDNQISNLSILASLTNLTKLYIWGNGISDISALAGLTSLTQLKINENSISNISILSRLTNLTELSLKENAISDISAVSGLTNLTELLIGNNTISDITPVTNLTNLEWLDMPNNSISDISAVQNLTQLVELYFQNNVVSDLSPLVANTGLGTDDELDVQGNPLSYPSIWTHIPALQARNVYVDFDNRVATAPVKILGDTQSGNTGTTLAQPFVVEVRDGSNVAFMGVPVTFAVTAGGGTLSATNTTTDANGRAQSTLTLGNTAGTNTVRVSVTGITQTIIFTATATTAPIVTVSPIVNRTSQVRDAIVDALPGVNSANDVTEAHLSTIRFIDLRNKGISTLNAGDFDRLTALTELRLHENQLRTLPANIFSDLSSLRTLYLSNNQLTTLPSGAFNGLTAMTNLYLNNNQLTTLPQNLFSGLSSLTQINLHSNRLTSLPADVFSGLSSLTQIFLRNNRLTSLPAGVFSGLSKLQYLYLDGNQLTSLPADVFSGLSSLTQLLLNNNQLSMLPAGVFRGLTGLTMLRLQANSVDPMPLTVSLEKVGVNQFKATAPAGAPFAIVLPISVANGSISSGVTTLTIPQGEVESVSLTVTRTPSTTAAVTVDIGNPLPGLPAQHQGYELVKSANLPLTVITDIIELPTDSNVCMVGDILAPGESCTYPGTDAVFSVLDDGKSQWNIPNLPSWLQFLNRVSVGGSMRISMTYNDVDYHFEAKAVSNNSWEIEEIGDETSQQPVTPVTPDPPGDIGVTPTLTTSTAAPITEATLHGGIITFNLSGGTFERSPFSIRDAITLTGITGVTVDTFGVDRISDTQATVELAFDGNMTTDSNLTISLGADAIKDYDGTALTSQLSVTVVTESIAASTASPLTEATLDESVVTLTLSGRTYESSISTIRDAVSVSGISGVTFPWHDPDKENDTQLTIKLEFDGDITSDSTLTFTVGAGAITGYNGPALTAQVSVSAGTETPVVTDGQTPVTPQQPETTSGTPTLSVTTAAPLTEATLHGGIITLNLSSGAFASSIFWIRNAVSVSGIVGVEVESFGGERISDTQATIELEYDGNMIANGTLTVSVESGAIEDYDGTALTSQLSISAVTESIAASTAAPLTEATLDESVITLTLSGRKFERFIFDIRDAVSVSGIADVTVGTFDIDRESDTEVTVELTFDGNMTSNGTLTFTVGANAIAGYNGPALTAQISVTANTESVVASTASPLTEATLDESIVTLTLSGRTFERSSFTIRDAVTISGIAGVTVDTFGVDRVSDTQATVELAFDGNMTANSTLTISLGAGAIKDYDGAALTSQMSVTAVTESVTASTDAPLTEATLDESVVTLTLSGRTYESFIFTIRDAVSVSGISGVTVGTFDIDRESDTEITVELTFDGDITTDGTLTFTVGADAIAGYNGPALTAQVSVTAKRENVLFANFPNPFNPETWIPYQLAKPTEVIITIHAMDGQVVRMLALGHQPAGLYQSRSRAAYWDGKNELGEKVASGLYFYTLITGDFTVTRTIVWTISSR